MEKIQTFLAEYYNYKINKAQTSVILEYLAQFPLDMVKRASTDIVQSETFFPLVSTWKTYLEPSDDLKADKAFTLAMSAIRKTGVYGCAQFEDKRIHAAIKSIGGWNYLCSTDTDVKWIKKNFIEAYKMHKEPEITGDGILKTALTATDKIDYYMIDGSKKELKQLTTNKEEA